MPDFKSLTVWQKSHQMVIMIYKITHEFPAQERYGLTDQIRRASVSIPANLAEGFGRHGDRERAHFINIALGSAAEVEYYCLLARDLSFITQEQFEELNPRILEIERMLNGLHSKIKADATPPRSR
jgi:four helix bundle protein